MSLRKTIEVVLELGRRRVISDYAIAGAKSKCPPNSLVRRIGSSVRKSLL